MSTTAPARNVRLKMASSPRRVKVRDDKSIAYRDAELGPWTVPVGRNGAGRSNSLSLSDDLGLTSFAGASESPEDARHKEAWVERRFSVSQQRPKYSPARDRPAMTRATDLVLCRGRAPSFDKLCRDLEQRPRREAVDV